MIIGEAPGKDEDMSGLPFVGSAGRYLDHAEANFLPGQSLPARQHHRHADGRKYATALITLDPEAIQGWAKEQGLSYSSDEELAGSQEVHDLIEGFVTQSNEQLERWETIKKFEILPGELSVEEGEVTPSLKVRRKTVEKKYADLLNIMYDAD